MIPSGAIYGKTQSGQEEVKNRKLKLPPKLRTMLILIDGTKPALLLRDEAVALGIPPDFLEQLEKLQLVKRVGTAATGKEPAQGITEDVPEISAEALSRLDKVARFRMAQQFMNDTAVNALGIKAFFFTLKLERCATVEDLRGLVDAYREAITKAGGEAEADVLTRRILELLGSKS